MNFGEVLLGIVVLAATFLAWRQALPREGKVRPFLRNEQAQTYYAIAIIAGVSIGLAYIIIGLVP